MIAIDGSSGEGGGQILRSALALSLHTGSPVRFEKIRAGRATPGLLRQHLTAVRAAAEVGGASVDGAELGSRELVFSPRRVQPGEYRFAVGSAGSACLVVQTVLPPLLLASAPSVLVVEGGTHNPGAPPWDFLARAFLPLVQRMGPRLRTRLERTGFYPAGGGRLRVEIEPSASFAPLALLERGAITARSVRALVAHIPKAVAERELHAVCEKLSGLRDVAQCVDVQDSAGPGNALLVELESEHVTEVFTGFGERGVRAETVAAGVVEEVRAYLAANVPVGPQLADQLILPLALAGEGVFRTLPLTLHAETNLDIVQRFLPVRARFARESAGSGRLELVRAS